MKQLFNLITLILVLFTFYSCQKDSLIITEPTDSISAPVDISSATVAQKADLMKAGISPYVLKYSDSALTLKYGVIQGNILFNGNSYVENMIWYNWDATWTNKGYKVINRGLGGTTWNEQVSSVPKLVTDYKPRLQILYSGENELLRGYTKEQAITGFNKFFDSTRKYNPGITILVTSMLTCPKLYSMGRADDIDAINIAYQSKVASDHMAKFHDIRTIVTRTDVTNWKSDSIHPSGTAYAKWWSNLKPIIDNPATYTCGY